MSIRNPDSGGMAGAGFGGVPIPWPHPDDPLVGRGYAAWWGKSLALFGRCWPRLLLVSAVPEIVFACASIGMEPIVRSNVPAGFVRVIDLGGPVLAMVAGALTGLAALVAVHVIVGSVVGERRLGPALRAARPRFGPMGGWSVVFMFLIGLGLLCCVLPGIYVLSVAMLLPAVVAFERVRVVRRAFQIFRTGSGTVLGRIGTILLMYVIVRLNLLLGLGEAMAPDLAATPNPLGFIVVNVAWIIAGIAVTALIYPFLVVTYAELRARDEPLSTPQLVAELNR